MKRSHTTSYSYCECKCIYSDSVWTLPHITAHYLIACRITSGLIVIMILIQTILSEQKLMMILPAKSVSVELWVWVLMWMRVGMRTLQLLLLLICRRWMHGMETRCHFNQCGTETRTFDFGHTRTSSRREHLTLETSQTQLSGLLRSGEVEKQSEAFLRTSSQHSTLNA